MKRWSNWLPFAVVAGFLLLVLLFGIHTTPESASVEVPYSEFKSLANDNQLESVVLRH